MIEEYVIIEKLNESINKRKVIAAVFYTFNFDAKFFENYLLPIFLPDANFSDLEIQNSILWRKYAKDLPPITVYCDFHAKSKDAPTLDYEVRAIDLKTTEGKKPCFHPKNSFILLEDWSLLILSGSNNLSIAGWCKNIEGISVIEMKGGKFFPLNLKNQYWDFVKNIRDTNNLDLSEAENELEKFFRQRQSTNNTKTIFYSSITKSFKKLCEELIEKNDNSTFTRVEVLSPYFSSSSEFIKECLLLLSDKNIYALTPYNATNIADITRETYDKFEKAGIVWSRLPGLKEDKVFRFNHSKIYRLKGNRKMYTIVGSVNFTDAAWRGNKENGNVENAIVFEDSIEKWEDWLVKYNNPEIQFSESHSDETTIDQRWDVPDLEFSIDWSAKKLYYNNLKKNNFSGIIKLPGKNYEIISGKNIEIQLNNNQIDSLANNSIIQVHEYGTQRDFYFFPIHLNIESRPYSSKLKLNDRELIQLWKQVSLKEADRNDISDLLEKFILSRYDNEGELIDKKVFSKSTLNMMASHINALIKLEERIFSIPNKVGEFRKAKELLDYYLFTNNVDTLYGYRNLLSEMFKDKAILPATEWFLLNLLINKFYEPSKVARFYKALRESSEGIKAKTENIRIEEMKLIKKSIQSDDINEKLYKWIVNQINE